MLIVRVMTQDRVPLTYLLPRGHNTQQQVIFENDLQNILTFIFWIPVPLLATAEVWYSYDFVHYDQNIRTLSILFEFDCSPCVSISTTMLTQFLGVTEFETNFCDLVSGGHSLKTICKHYQLTL